MEEQMNDSLDSFLEAVRGFVTGEVKKHLKEGKICIAGRTTRLNSNYIIDLYKGQRENTRQNGKTTTKVESINDIRKIFNSYFKKMVESPLRCNGEECEECALPYQTCLPDVQELFLWSLQATPRDSMELAVLLWNHCDDKIACACIGWAVKTELMSRADAEPDQKTKLEQDAKEFQQLAISTLKGCHSEDSDMTRSLLRKECRWWNNFSTLQLVVGTQNKEFLAQPACTQHMTLLWMGEIANGSSGQRRVQTLVDAEPDDSTYRWCHWPAFKPSTYLAKPVVRYSISLILHIVFLGVYSYVLLFSFSKNLNKTFHVLIVWVADITANELSQALNPNPWSNSEFRKVVNQCKFYWKQSWNWLDVLTIALFVLGMSVFAENEIVHVFGRTVLSIDIFFFCIRMLQLLMVFNELGLLLVMVRKMIKDTINFMFILLVFVFAFAVSSEAILYTKRELGYRHIFLILRKAYWQVFGELFLDEISISASGNDDSTCTDPPCPSTYGQFFVPIMLGFYVMVTNVLLLNLLIARFNMTFTKVHDQAVEYQSWHRTMIIIEYHDQPHLPPPLNILRLTYSCLAMSFVMCCGKSVHVFQQCRRKNETENNKENDNDNKNENNNENKFEYKELKDLEQRHAQLACQEVKPRVFGMLGDNEDKENNFADTDKTLTMMQEQVIKLCQDINLLRRNIKQETCHCRREREMLY